MESDFELFNKTYKTSGVEYDVKICDDMIHLVIDASSGNHPAHIHVIFALNGTYNRHKVDADY